ncbi:SDR family oxidoreductase [Rapidithrix thailandica]|uniref:SDR family oxidoreductase n=1 Tax=Rapidithrix thailandica TaxID=413964 RepID=A0AAW9SIR4_9BACT
MDIEKTPFSLTGKNIIVTGASSGIGRQCAINCSQMGANVILLGRDKQRLDQTLNSTTTPLKHLTYSLDLLDYSKVEEVLKDIVSQKGKIHGLVNCAGISTTLPLRAITPRKLDEFLHTNVHGGIQLTKLVTKKAFISEEGGCIIFITSVMGAVGEAGKSLYSMSKGALIAGSKSLAIELASKKIRVNCISPGVVETPMSKEAVYSQDETSLNQIKSYHPLGLGQAEDVANACIYLLSEASKWVTGINLFVDGGYTAR